MNQNLVFNGKQKASAIFRQGDVVSMQVGNAVVRCAVMLVSPDLAREWLILEHPKNRRTPGVTAKYAAEMTAGGWRPSPQPIVFAQSGVLMDGGNRLRAIISSGTTQLLTIWFDWPDEAFPCLDRNAPRTIYQADNMTGEALPLTAYQMARSMILIDESRTSPADTEIRDRAKVLLVPWRVIGPALSSIRVGRSGIRVPVSLACCIAWLSDADLVVRFISELQAASEHATVPSLPVKNFLRWYENVKVSAGTFVVKDTAWGACSALRHAATNSAASNLRPTQEAWNFWRRREQVISAFAAIGVG